MKKNMKIDIEKPCGQKFESFTPTDAGGFCGNCQKEVVDFSIMSDAEIIDYFKLSSKNTCGRFSASQLKNYPVSDSLNSPAAGTFKRIRFWGISLLALLPFTEVYTQNIPSNTTIKQELVSLNPREKPEMENSDSCTVKGVVWDGKETIPFVNVILKGKQIGTSTDIDGQFCFPVPLKKGDVLIFSFVGYAKLEYELSALPTEPLKITLREMDVMMGEVVILGEVAVEEVYSSKKSLWKGLINIFR